MAQNLNSSNQVHNVKATVEEAPKMQQNHLSSSAQLMLKYEERNLQIEDVSKSVLLTKQIIQNEIKEPFEPSIIKSEDLIKKYGTMIEYQTMFLRKLIYDNYVPYLPEKFKIQFSQIMMLGGAFEAVWWGSLAFTLFRAYKYRHTDLTFRQKAGKGIGATLLFVFTSLGFHNQIYIPKMRTCFYKNIKSIDSLMDKHLRILKSCGVSLDYYPNPTRIQKNQEQNNQKIVPTKELSNKEQVPKK